MSRIDPRIFQVLFLGCLLGVGAFFRDFAVRPGQVVLTFASALAVQAFFIHRLRLAGSVNYLSAGITAFSLSLLLRADSYWAHPVAAALAIAAKFLVRVGGKHVFNPGNLGVVLALLFLPGTWTSAGQWGQDVAVAAWVFMLGTLVTQKARRADVSWAFLAFFLGGVLLRVLVLGQRPAVFLHQLTNGSLLLFAFFMISDPMTIPNHRKGRILYAFLVAMLALLWQYGLFRTNGLIWSLFLLSPLVPFLDRWLPASRYQWIPTGGSHVAHDPTPVPVRHVSPAGARVPVHHA
jgi:Na+-transporting NADH:ubiquinone oxidoreductase subunit NqrB